jgi:ABC-type molybdate transport system ATPase subunit
MPPPVVFVLCRAGTSKFLAEITINSEEKLSISTGEKCYAIIKTVSIIPYKVRKV